MFLFVWLLGYEALPLAHIALHAQLAPHTHGEVDATLVHCHGDLCHSEDRPDRERGGKAAPQESPTSHGQNSLEHRGLAALAPGLIVFALELTLIAELENHVAPRARAVAFASVSPPVRGPPSSVDMI